VLQAIDTAKNSGMLAKCHRFHQTKSPSPRSLKSKFLSIALLIPNHSFDQQKDMAARISGTQVLIDTATKHQADLSEQLNAMLPGILDQAFNGEELRV